MRRAARDPGEPSEPFAADAPCAWASALIPLIFAVCSANGAASWESDAALVRDLGLSAVGSEGALSTLLVQLASLLPVGGHVLRASFVGSLALAVAARALFGLSLGWLRSGSPRGGLDPWLALLASQLWALSPAVLTLAAVPGHPFVGLALMLFGMARWVDHHEPFDARSSATTGMLFGLAVAEHHALGAVLLAVAAAVAWQRRPLIGSRRVLCAALGFGGAVCACALVRWLPSWSPDSEFAGGLSFAAKAAEPQPVAPSLLELGQCVLAGLGAPLGWVPAALGLAGVVGSLRAPESRRAALGFWVLLAVGASAPVFSRLGAEHTAASLSLCFGLAVSAGAGACLRFVMSELWLRPLPFGRPASVLAGTFAITLVLQQMAARPLGTATLYAPSGAELWTDEALGKLPPNAALLVRTPALALRLLAARVVSADRPDVLIVPVPFLSRGRFLERTWELEPQAAPVLRQLLANGSADEYSLARLADQRPTFVEIDPEWDRRQLEHLRPEGVWLGFSPHPLGSADREAAVLRARALLVRLSRALPGGDSFDPLTAHAFGTSFIEQSDWLLERGEEEDAQRLRRGAVRLRLANKSKVASESSPAARAARAMR